MNKNAILAVLVVAVLIFMLSACNGSTGQGAGSKPECNDRLDNDGDGKIDMSDSGCSSRSDNDESNCGDARCEGAETCATCPTDCGACCTPACKTNMDCGTSGYVGSPYCKEDGNAYRDYMWYTCGNPGTCNALCNSQTLSYVWQVCANVSKTCVNGVCA